MTAEDLGWGTPEQCRTRQTTIDVDNVRLTCHRDAAPLLKMFLEECVELGYSLDEQADDWGYAHRKIRGSKTAWSNHAWGLALDINAIANPMTVDGRITTNMPRWMVDLGTRKYGLTWGGSYSGSRKDGMHWEVTETPAQVKARIAALQTTQPVEEDDWMASPKDWDEKDKIAVIDVISRAMTKAFAVTGTKSASGTAEKLIEAVQTGAGK